MKKIVHLTDLHLGDGNCTETFDNVVNNIIGRLTRANEYIIIITGDLMEKVKSIEDYALAKDYIVKLENAGFIVLVVPGNHDYGRGTKQDEEFVPMFKDVFYGDKYLQYPKKDVIDGIAFIGLDSMEEEVKGDSIFADGRLGELQLNRLNDMLNEDNDIRNAIKRVVYLHHRPFDYLATGHLLNDREDLKRTIQGKVDVLLFGHRHKHKTFHGEWGIPRIYDGGSSTKKNGDYSPHVIIDIVGNRSNDISTDFY